LSMISAKRKIPSTPWIAAHSATSISSRLACSSGDRGGSGALGSSGKGSTLLPFPSGCICSSDISDFLSNGLWHAQSAKGTRSQLQITIRNYTKTAPLVNGKSTIVGNYCAFQIWMTLPTRRGICQILNDIYYFLYYQLFSPFTNQK
jgi:hypothetical protein